MALVTIECGCKGKNSACVNCNGTRKQVRVACARCNGTGCDSGIANVGGKCVDCRGAGWREMDQPGHRF